jgi:hypothetical protein
MKNDIETYIMDRIINKHDINIENISDISFSINETICHFCILFKKGTMNEHTILQGRFNMKAYEKSIRTKKLKKIYDSR